MAAHSPKFRPALSTALCPALVHQGNQSRTKPVRVEREHWIYRRQTPCAESDLVTCGLGIRKQDKSAIECKTMLPPPMQVQGCFARCKKGKGHRRPRHHQTPALRRPSWAQPSPSWAPPACQDIMQNKMWLLQCSYLQNGNSHKKQAGQTNF